MDNHKSREEISSKTVFFLVMGASLFSPYSLWRFPIWVKYNGGAAIIVPYSICVLVLVIPLVFLELSLGQFMQRAGTRIWAVVPLFKGLSIVAMFISLLRSSLNLVMASWSGYFLYLTLRGQMPDCTHQPEPLNVSVQLSDWTLEDDGDWPGLGSRHDDWLNSDVTGTSNLTIDQLLNSFINDKSAAIVMPNQIDDVATGYSTPGNGNATWNSTQCWLLYQSTWSQTVLQASANIVEPGSSIMPVFCGSILAALLCLLVVIRGIRWSSKIFCLLTPLKLAATLALLIGACLLRTGNARQGIESLLKPDFDHVAGPELWFSCVHQVLVIHCMACNLLPSVASYQRWSNNVLRDTVVICLLVAFINLFVCISMWAVVERLEIRAPNSTEDLFQVLPHALSQMPYAASWSTLFYLLVVVVTVSSSAIYWETIVLALTDTSAKLIRWRTLIATAVGTLSFLIANPLSLQNGIYIFRFVSYVVEGPFLVCGICLLHSLVLGLLYGGGQFYDNLETMTGNKPHWWMKFCWTFVCPFILLATISYQAYEVYKAPLRLGREPPFHFMASVMLGVVVTLVLAPIVLAATWVFCSGRGGCGRKLRRALHPQLEGHQIPLRWRIEGTFHKFTSL